MLHSKFCSNSVILFVFIFIEGIHFLLDIVRNTTTLNLPQIVKIFQVSIKLLTKLQTM